ncbi:MAG: SDR family oxidoreductase [Candidatus Hydrogenedentes bacterium]|nr:SDR family oxidoreductase [Candidatus Hydrogenedentota bacterium]
MSYFITGATGFIGGELVCLLAKRKGTIYALVRPDSEHKLDALRKQLGLKADRLVAVRGDLTKPHLGVRKDVMAKMEGKVKHFFHLAAQYDMMSDDEEHQLQVNVEGTREAVSLAEELKAKCFHHMSSVAVAGLFQGYWQEDMFEEADEFDQPYFKSKRLAEAVVRNECKIPYRIYRPGIVVGNSKTGETTKADGPYYLFKFLQRVRNALPAWVPLVGLEGGRINIVPVDYVASATDYLAHKTGLNGRTFHLTDPQPYRSGEALNIFAKASRAPQFAMRIDARMLDIIPKNMRELILQLPPVKRLIESILRDLGVPKETLTYINYPTRFDSRDTQRALEGSGIACPRLDTYAPVIWDYWERNLDPDANIDRTLAGAVRDKVVVITGSSSGIGKATALKVGAAGGIVCLVARREDMLKEVQAEIKAAGGTAHIYPADLSVLKHCDEVLADVMKDHGRVDILINNAGKSIRRSIRQSYDRFHDFERLMQLNYFAAVKLIMGVLPQMTERKQGHIINVSTLGVLANSPRFSGYIASKAALDAFSRCVQAEFLDKDVKFTTINMPLVRTPMIDPTRMYEHVPALTEAEAADMLVQAIIYRPKRIATRLGVFAQVMTTLLPGVSDVVLNTAYKLFPDSAKKKDDAEPKDDGVSPEAMVFAALMRGIHW